MNPRRTLAMALLVLGAPLAAPASGQEISVRFGRFSANVGATETRPAFHRPAFDGSVRYAHRRPAVRGTTYAPHTRRTYGHARVWVPGCYETVLRRVWVPGGVRRVYEEPRYELRTDSCGNPVRVLVCHGGWRTKYVPGCYETKRVRVWRPGHWV